MPTTSCPACGSNSDYLTDWIFSGLGDSIFNYVADFYSCKQCGLVHVQNITDTQLAKFYTEECAYFDNPHFDVMAPANIEKYVAYKDFMQSHDLSDVNVADIGCGRGGFVSWLKKNGWGGSCCGVDVDIKSIPASTEDATEVQFKCGGVLDLPFDNGSQSLLTYFHVLEHICDINGLLAEASRVLKADGHLLIEVPDAESYENQPIGSAFWISIREHIFHFSSCSLMQALHRHGFSVVNVTRRTLPTPEFMYPSLMVLAKRDSHCTALPDCSAADIAGFVLQSKAELEQQVAEVSTLRASHDKITFWGCSAELLSLLPLIDLRQAVLCDSSKLKQKSSYKDHAIQDPSDIKPAGVLVIAPYLHGEKIEQAALKLGWRKDAIHRLK